MSKRFPAAKPSLGLVTPWAIVCRNRWPHLGAGNIAWARETLAERRGSHRPRLP